MTAAEDSPVGFIFASGLVVTLFAGAGLAALLTGLFVEMYGPILTTAAWVIVGILMMLVGALIGGNNEDQERY